MPIARVQLPDGKIARLEVPEGTTPEQVESFVFNMKPPSAAARDTAKWEAQIKKDAAPTKLERFGRGFADVVEGVQQGAGQVRDMLPEPLRAITQATPTGALNELITPKDTAAYTAEKSGDLARYEHNRGPDAGIDLMRLGGNLTAAAPAMLAPGGQTLPARMAIGALQGGGTSSLMFTPEGESKAGQIALGTAFGGATPAVAGPVVNKVANWWKGPTAAPTVQKLTGELEIKLQQQGIDWKGLTSEVQQSLLADAQKALSTGGTLDDAMLKNKAVIESVGAKPTRAAITRNPRDWQSEKNLRGIQGVGDDIVTREQGNAQAMVDYLGKLKTGTGGKTSTALEAGESAVNAIKLQDKDKARVVDDLYQAYRDSGLKDAKVPETKLMESLTQILDEVGQDNIPSAIQGRLKEFGFLGGQRTRDLTVQQADTFNRLLNANNPGHGPESKVIGMLRGALNESLIETPGAGASLTKAREAAAQRFAEQRAGKGIEAAIDDVSPDRFVQKFVLNADARDLKAMLGELGKSAKGTQAIADVKGHVIESLLLKATGATNADEVMGQAFSGARFGKALDGISPEKLHALFKPEEVEALRTLQKASKLLTEDVAFSDVNHSKTTAALANLFLKIGNTPFLGKLVSPIIGTAKIGMDWVQDANSRKQVAEALLGSAGKAGERKALPAGRFEKVLPGATAATVNQASEDK